MGEEEEEEDNKNKGTVGVAASGVSGAGGRDRWDIADELNDVLADGSHVLRDWPKHYEYDVSLVNPASTYVKSPHPNRGFKSGDFIPNPTAAQRASGGPMGSGKELSVFSPEQKAKNGALLDLNDVLELNPDMRDAVDGKKTPSHAYEPGNENLNRYHGEVFKAAEA